MMRTTINPSSISEIDFHCISSISENLPQWPEDVPHWMLQDMFLYLLVLKEHYLYFFPHSDVGWVACGKDNKVKNR